MVQIYFFIVSVIFYMLVFGGVLHLLYSKHIRIANRMNAYFNIDEDKTLENNKENPGFIRKNIDEVKREIELKMPAAKSKTLERRLREAGYPLKLSPVDFRLLQMVIGIILFLFMNLLLLKSGTSIISSLFLASLIATLGIYYPSFHLSKIIKKRNLVIQKMMPDFFDMVNLSIEAGMGLDASLLKVCHQLKGPLSDEFKQTLEDMKLGKSRREAFADLRSRVPVHQFQSIITSLIQADLLGVGMSKVLRSLTVRIREQRTQFAREQAMKAPVKMVFPMLIFIFPAIFIVMLGPLVIYLLDTVFK